MTGVVLFWRWKDENQYVPGHADITDTNFMQNAKWFLGAQRGIPTSIRVIEYSGLSRDAMEYLSEWAAHPTFHPRRKGFNECGCVVQRLPDLHIPSPVNIPLGEQLSLPALDDSLLHSLMKSYLACACLDKTALDVKLTSTCETIKYIQATLLGLRNSPDEAGCMTDAVRTPATSDVQVQISNDVANTIEEAVSRSLESDERWRMQEADRESERPARHCEDTRTCQVSHSRSSSSNPKDEKEDEPAELGHTNTPKGSARGVRRTSQVGLPEPAPKRVPPPPPSPPCRPREVSDSGMLPSDDAAVVPLRHITVPALTRAPGPRVVHPSLFQKPPPRAVPPPRRMPPPPPRPQG
jgi:hypothetical protein